uniref:Uncharacterized protein n=1 Tax=Nelumbo nucifera TaxID=4432 RepID=A0A822YYB0_NELNU|nr:TPA_asm: hypothetical protein HUJ06_007844 [Nelumbo nucifera]
MAPEPVHSGGASQLEFLFLSMRREIGRVTIRNLLSRTSELKTVGESLTEEERAACLIESYRDMDEEV